MKKYLLGTAALLAARGCNAGRCSADLGTRYPMKAPPMVAPVWTWTGFYVGINGGYGWGRSHWALLPAGLNEGSASTRMAARSAARSATTGSSAAGWSASKRRATGRTSSGSNVSLVAPRPRNRTNIDAFGLFTGKVGYAWNNFMVYAKGGAAVQSVDYRWFTTATNVTGGTARRDPLGRDRSASASSTPSRRTGRLVVEYNHMFMGNRDVTFAPAPNVTDRIRLDTDVFTGRINYRFGGPAISRY